MWELLIAIFSAVVSVSSLTIGYFLNKKLEKSKSLANLELEKFRSELLAKQVAANRAQESQQLVARYRDPLLRTAFDLQSRLFNILRPGGFRGGTDPEYFGSNTLYVFAEFLGWLEIIRRDMQFLDLGAVEETRDLNARIGDIQRCLNHTSRRSDPYYLYRGQQRAIGELMMAARSGSNSAGPRYETIGYAEFCRRMRDDPDHSRWFTRLQEQVQALPDRGSPRLVELQHHLIDLLDFLDAEYRWFPRDRKKIRPTSGSEP